MIIKYLLRTKVTKYYLLTTILIKEICMSRTEFMGKETIKKM